MKMRCVLLALLSAAMLIGQADRGVITGLVTDAQGAAISNATVQIKDIGTGVVTTVKTTSEGNYSTPPLVIGSYEVSVSQAGFKGVSRQRDRFGFRSNVSSGCRAPGR